MYAQTHLYKRKTSSRYYFRIRIPIDIKWVYGKSEIKKSLQTRDQRVAKRRALELTEHYTKEFEAARARHKIAREGPKMALDASQESIQAICDQWRYQALTGDEQFRTGYPDPNEVAEYHQNRQSAQNLLNDALTSGRLEEIVKPAFEQFLYLSGYKLELDSDTYRQFLYRFAQTLSETNTAAIQRSKGVVIPTPAEPESNLTIDEVFSHWKKQYSGGREKTVERTEGIVNEFVECVGNKPSKLYQRTDVIKYRDHLLDIVENGTKTVETKIALLRAVFQVSVDDGYLDKNPASKIRIPKTSKKKTRIPFTSEDLKLIFNSPIYTEGLRMVGGKGEASVWLPLISLYQGLREEEIGQLRVDDIRCEQDIWYFNILEEDEGSESQTRLKNDNSARNLPIHSKLIGAGFLAYFERIKKEGHVRLFPELSPNRYDVLTANWSKWFHRYLRNSVGITDERKVFHSFRHCFRDACRKTIINEELSDQLMGHKHKEQSSGRGYGEGFLLYMMKEAIDKIEYDFISIPILEGKGSQSNQKIAGLSCKEVIFD